MVPEGRTAAVAGTLSEPSDDELMKRLRKGDMDALGTIYESHRGVVGAVLRLRGVRLAPSDAEDTCHEVFLTLIDLAPRFRPGNTLRGWLCGIALRKARRLADRDRRRGLLGKLLPGFRAEPARAPPALARTEAASLLAQLPEELQEVMVLTYVESLSAEEVAFALGISPKTVANRLYRARILARDFSEGAAS